jgi:hypothetical protein
MKLIPAVLMLLTFVNGQNQSNCWRGICPLRSGCEEIKDALKVKTCTLPISQYTLADFRVMIEFENESCDRQPHGWRVPKGTVIAITVTPRNELRPSELDLDLSKYKKREDGEIIGMTHYESESNGVTVQLYKGFIHDLFLYPRKSDEILRCKH